MTSQLLPTGRVGLIARASVTAPGAVQPARALRQQVVGWRSRVAHRERGVLQHRLERVDRGLGAEGRLRLFDHQRHRPADDRGRHAGAAQVRYGACQRPCRAASGYVV